MPKMHSPFVRFPKLYARLSSLRKTPNYEKILYLRTVKKGAVVIDAGANRGYFTTLFSMLVGSTGEVHAFEPVPETYDLLLTNTRRRTSNVKANHLAVGRTRGKAPISYDLDDSEKASLAHASATNANSCEVEVIPLDEYMNEEDIRRLDFVKVDVEGYELQALHGMNNSLKKFTPQLSIEVTLLHEERPALFSFLKQVGYDAFRVIEKGYPAYDSSRHSSEDYFYLHAFSSKTA